MNKRFFNFLLLIVSMMASALFSTQALADTQYVSDHLIITVRTGQGAQYQIIKTLASGTRLKVLEETESGYARIETADGVEGWVRTQYLTKQPVASEKLARVEAQLIKVKTEFEKLKAEFSTLSNEYNLLSKNQSSLSSEKKQLDSELARLSEVAKKPIMLDKVNRELQQKNVALEKDLQRLNQENNSLNDRSQREWFIAGALVLFGGLILGLLIPKLRSRKSNAW